MTTERDGPSLCVIAHSPPRMVVDSLVDALLDCADPNAVRASHKLVLDGSDVAPRVVVDMGGILYTLDIAATWHVLLQLAARVTDRPSSRPSLLPAVTSIMVARDAASAQHRAFQVRGAH